MPLDARYEGTETERAINSPRLKAFLAMTPAEAGAHIDTHVVDVPSAKVALKDAFMLLAVMKEFIKKQK